MWIKLQNVKFKKPLTKTIFNITQVDLKETDKQLIEITKFGSRCKTLKKLTLKAVGQTQFYKQSSNGTNDSNQMTLSR